MSLMRSRSTRPFVASAVAAATASTLIAVAPAANAWETKYNPNTDQCTISFSNLEVQRINGAYSQLFTEMGNATNNDQLTNSFAQAANQPFLGKHSGPMTIEISPDEATKASNILYGVDLANIALPYGVQGVISNAGLKEILGALDTEELTSYINVKAILDTIDWKAAIGEDFEPKNAADPALEAVMAIIDELDAKGLVSTEGLTEGIKVSLPKNRFGIPDVGVLMNVANTLRDKNTSTDQKIAAVLPLIQIDGRPLKANRDELNKVVDKVIANFKNANNFEGTPNYDPSKPELKDHIVQEFKNAFEKSGIEPVDELKKALAATGADPKKAIENIINQPQLRDEVEYQIKSIPFKDLIKNAIEDSGNELSLESLLGYSVNDVLDAGKGGLSNAAPGVVAPIVSMREAFNACEPNPEVDNKVDGEVDGASGSTRDGSSIRKDRNTAEGSVMPGSSELTSKQLGIFVGVGVVAALLGLVAFGFQLRPIWNDLAKFFHI
ncbi:hypothetical protein [Corynebacterium urinipleomorphum]|uniref:hypothetical protein n=1 Tax=Corynebacterium urinipleomorphum TaxID=1852380 RepID=UPI000B356D95|nr:hypothetical protein [Corynebacterium urinipleomorphum]